MIVFSNQVPNHLKPVFYNIIDTLANYGFAYDDYQSKYITDGMQLVFLNNDIVNRLQVFSSGHELWTLASKGDGFVARKIVEKIMEDFNHEEHLCQINSKWLNIFR